MKYYAFLYRSDKDDNRTSNLAVAASIEDALNLMMAFTMQDTDAEAKYLGSVFDEDLELVTTQAEDEETINYLKGLFLKSFGKLQYGQYDYSVQVDTNPTKH